MIPAGDLYLAASSSLLNSTTSPEASLVVQGTGRPGGRVHRPPRNVRLNYVSGGTCSPTDSPSRANTAVTAYSTTRGRLRPPVAIAHVRLHVTKNLTALHGVVSAVPCEGDRHR